MNKNPVTPPPPSSEGTSLWPIDPLQSILLSFKRDPPNLHWIQVINCRIILAIWFPGSFTSNHRWLVHRSICHTTIMNLNPIIALTLNWTINQHSSIGTSSVCPTRDLRYLPTLPLLNHTRILTVMVLYIRYLSYVTKLSIIKLWGLQQALVH